MKYAVTPDVVADATLQGLLKRKREVIVPKFYKWYIKLYQTSPERGGADDPQKVEADVTGDGGCGEEVAFFLKSRPLSFSKGEGAL